MQCSRMLFVFTKVMNKLISTKNRIFISLVEPIDSGKRYLIHEWLKVGTFQHEFDKNYFFYQQPQPLYVVKQKGIDNLEFVQGVHFEIINSLETNVPSICYFLMTHVQKFAALRNLWTLLPLADIADLVLYTLNTTCSTKIN